MSSEKVVFTCLYMFMNEKKPKQRRKKEQLQHDQNESSFKSNVLVMKGDFFSDLGGGSCSTVENART